uniref:Uncharacterized protein n=1 Tax=Panagrellus redivivus TaxID=6233 RepID=A0A7E4VAE5_PANRE
MEVSSLLIHAPSKLALLNGEQHDIVETESGIEVGGEPLTFESWARMNSGPESDVIALIVKKRNFDNRVQLQPSVIDELDVSPKKAKSQLPPKPSLQTSDSDDDDDDFNPQNKARRTVVRAQQRCQYCYSRSLFS